MVAYRKITRKITKTKDQINSKNTQDRLIQKTFVLTAYNNSNYIKPLNNNGGDFLSSIKNEDFDNIVD